MTGSTGGHRLRILFFSQRFLYPMDTGGKIRTAKLLENLKNVFDVTVISNFEPGKDDRYLSRMQELCSKYHPVPWREIAKYSLGFYLRTLWRSFSRYPVTVVNDYSPDLESKLLEVAAKGPFDLLICDFLQPTLNFRRVKGVPTLLFLHNVESVITRRHFEVAGNPFTKFFWWRQWVKMDRYEREACRRFSAVVAVSDVDREILEKKMGAKKVGAIPTGVDAKYFTPGNGPIEENSLVFTGAMDWLPNEDGILFFAREILPRISVEIPDVRLTVVGRNPSARLAEELKGYPEIRAVGRVDDIRPWVSRHVLYVVPLRIGGGTRIKIYEAMAMGKAVVSTRIGAEGLPVTSGHDVILADRPEDFARAVVRLLRNGEERRRLEDAARSYVEENASWECAAETFARLCRAAAQEAAPEPW